MKKISNKYPLIVENHPEDYDGYDFITLIRYNDRNYLTIVDNMHLKFIDCYVLDMCSGEGLDESFVIDIASYWYENNRDNYPVSIEFSKAGHTASVSKILRSFAIDYVTRVIGPLPQFQMKGMERVRKRKRKSIPKGVKIIQKNLK